MLATVGLLASAAVALLLSCLFSYHILKALLRFPDPDLEPGEELSFRSPCAITYDSMLGFSNGHVFVTNRRLIWTPTSFPKPLFSREISVPLDSISEAHIASRALGRAFAIPVEIMVPGHVLKLFVGLNSLSLQPATTLINALTNARAASRRDGIAFAAEPVQLPFNYNPRLEAAGLVASVLVSGMLLVVFIQWDMLTPLVATCLVLGPMLSAVLFIYQRKLNSRLK